MNKFPVVVELLAFGDVLALPCSHSRIMAEKFGHAQQSVQQIPPICCNV